jgi:signal transduction histidine kinase
MTLPPTPLRERDRLSILHGLGILDTPPDPAFDALTRLAAEMLAVPIALVSLVDAHRQWFKSRSGLARAETPREDAFCAHAIAGDGLFEVTDAFSDPRFHDNPLVTGDPGIRFYAGMPLRIEGHAVGTLCVIDRSPRRLDAYQRSLLAQLAGMAERQLALHGRLVAASLADRRLGDFVAASGDWAWETDGLRVCWVSDNVAQRPDDAVSNHVGRLLTEGILDDDARCRADNVRALEAIRAQQPFRDLAVRRHATTAGDRIEVKSGVPVHDTSGRFVGYRGVSRDATEAMAARREGEVAESRLREAIEAINEGFLMTDAQGRIVLTNARWRAVNVLPGQPVPVDLEAHLRCMVASGRVASAVGCEEAWIAERLAARRRKSNSFEFRMHGRDLVGHDLRLSDGGCVTVTLDISALKADHRAALQAAQRLELAVSAAGLSVWEADLDTGELVWPLAGKVGSDGDGVPAARTLHEALARVDAIDRQRVTDSLRDVWDGRRVSVREEFSSAYGPCIERAVIEATMAPTEPGRPRRMIGVRRDVTAIRRAEQAARQKTAADLANQAKSEFLARIGHELRTPLNAISGLAQVLHREPDGEPAQGRRSLVAHILSASDHLSALLDDLLDMAQVESGRVAIRAEAVPVATVLRGCLRMMAPQAAGHGIALEMARVPEGLAVHADPTRLRQIVLNLLSNAIKYNRRQGSVRLEAGDEELNGFVSIAVTDTGPGLSREELGRIFRPFERLSRGDGLSSEGLGLGLSIAQGLAVAMAGSIEVRSEPGRGTVFTVHLPAAAAGGDAVPGSAGPDTAAFAPAGASSEPSGRVAATVVHPALGPGGFGPPPQTDPPVRTESTRPASVSPAAGPAVAGPAAAPPGAAPESPRRVLYVEDNRLNAVLMQQIARQVPGLSLRVVESGEEALAVVRDFAPDLLLLDNDLPGASGMEIHAVLRSDPRYGAMRCVLVSADATAASIERARSLGFDDYWVKPLDVERVIGALGGSAVAA